MVCRRIVFSAAPAAVPAEPGALVRATVHLAAAAHASVVPPASARTVLAVTVRHDLVVGVDAGAVVVAVTDNAIEAQPGEERAHGAEDDVGRTQASLARRLHRVRRRGDRLAGWLGPRPLSISASAHGRREYLLSAT